MNRYGLFLAGNSGMGIDSSGAILMNALAKKGYWCNANREFPSLIKGGESTFNIHFACHPVRAESNQYDIGVGMGKVGVEHAMKALKSGSLMVHNFERWEKAFPTLIEDMKAQGIDVLYVPTREILKEKGLSILYENTIVIGALAHVVGLTYEEIEAAMYTRYGKKQALRENNKDCLRAGYDLVTQPVRGYEQPERTDTKRMLIDGNTALAMGAIHAGVRAYYAYPMSPSTSILHYFAATAEETGVLVKQAEDEITAIQMNIGSMYAGTRAMTSTSGGGLDLMAESISLTGITEVPIVLVVAQRPGPGTGLPTWTAQGDLNLALHAGHGEYARIVLAVSDQMSAFYRIQEAFNLAEKYQVPVIVLTEKWIAENRATIDAFETGTIPIERGLVTDPHELGSLVSTDRYKLTETGVSKRWIPGSSETFYYCNGDEHHEDGTLDESEATSKMIMKRIQKKGYIEDELSLPEVYGDENPDITLVGRGSTKCIMHDVLDELKARGVDYTVEYVHVEWLYPVKKLFFKELHAVSKKLCVVENNATGQFADLLQTELGLPFGNRILKWNGRQFSVEELIEEIEKYVE